MPNITINRIRIDRDAWLKCLNWGWAIVYDEIIKMQEEVDMRHLITLSMIGALLLFTACSRIPPGVTGIASEQGPTAPFQIDDPVREEFELRRLEHIEHLHLEKLKRLNGEPSELEDMDIELWLEMLEKEEIDPGLLNSSRINTFQLEEQMREKLIRLLSDDYTSEYTLDTLPAPLADEPDPALQNDRQLRNQSDIEAAIQKRLDALFDKPDAPSSDADEVMPE